MDDTNCWGRVGFTILLLLVGGWLRPAKAQITINEKMELQAKTKTSTEPQQEDDVKALVGSLPKRSILYPLGGGKYLVLRTGRLKLSVGEAVLYGPQTPTRTRLTIQRRQATTQTEIQRNIASSLMSPVVIDDKGQEILFYRRSFDIVKGVEADTYVDWKKPLKNYGDSQRIQLEKYLEDEEKEMDPGRYGLIKFGFDDSWLQNGTLQQAKLQLQPEVIRRDEPYPDFSVHEAKGNWTEGTVDWETQPPAGGGIFVTEDDLTNIRYFGPNDSLKTGIYKIDVIEYVSRWVRSGSDGMVLKDRGGSRIDPEFVSIEGALVNIGQSPPGLNMTIGNTSTNPEDTIIDIGYVEAGDVLTLHFNELESSLMSPSRDIDFPDDRVRQGMRFWQVDSAYTEFLEVGLLMEEDTTRRPYITMDLQADTTTLATGDTVALHPKLEFDNGIQQPFSYRQRFTTGIIRERQAGTLLNVGKKDTADFFNDLETPWAFIANDSLSSDSVKTTIDAHTDFQIGEDVIILANNNSDSSSDTGHAKPTAPDSTAPSIIFPPDGPFFSTPVQDSLQLTVKKETGGKILLGQTKYYYAVKDPNHPGKLQIKSIDTQFNEEPTVPSGAIAGAFDDDPIEAVSGGKSGVYWERKWPEISSNGTLTMHPLSDKLIRLVGRYWEDDKSYKVKLGASAAGRTGQLEIKVVEPEKLGEDDSQRIYTDAFGNEHNLDSLAIAYGGRTGMPPQFLKGIISQESSRLASYRYEPDLDYTYQMDDQPWKVRAREDMQGNPYWITNETDEGDPPIPSNHTIYDENQNVIPYPGFDGTMYDLFNQRREAEIRNRDQVTDVLDSLRTTVEQELKNQNIDSYLIESRTEEIAEERLNEWLKTTYRGGLDNIAKQTRIMASYGPMQLIYLFGYYEVGYPVDDQHLPETLNEDEDLALNYSLRFLIRRKFNHSATGNGVSFSDNEQWPEGYEESIRRGANLFNGNGGGADAATRKGYGNDVWIKALNYNPIK